RRRFAVRLAGPVVDRQRRARVDRTSALSAGDTLPPPCVLTRLRGLDSTPGNSAADVGAGHPNRITWIALPRSPPPSAPVIYRIRIGRGRAPAHADVPAGIIETCADIACGRRPPNAGDSQAAPADGRVRASGPRLAFRLLVCGLRLIEIFRHIGKSSLVRC